MICEYCHKKHNGEYGSGRFCSKYCAHRHGSQINRTERNQKIRQSCIGKKYPSRKPWHHTEEIKHKISETQHSKWLIKIKTIPFEILSYAGMKAIVFNEQKGLCAKCNNTFFWLGQKLNPELHHKDGNRKNNIRDNVELVCPNCHSLTKHFRFNGRMHTKKTRGILREKGKGNHNNNQRIHSSTSRAVGS